MKRRSVKRQPRFLARALRSQSPIPSYMPSLSTLSGITVTPQTALTFTAWFAGVNVIATDIASLPRGVFRRVAGGTVVPAFDRPQHALVHVAPNADMNAFRFWQAGMGHVLGWGNAFYEIVRKGGAEVAALFPLDPRTTRIKWAEGKRLYYEIDDGRAMLWPDDVLHVAGFGFDGIQGYCPVTLAREAIGLGKGAEEFGAALFGNGAIPKGILKVPKRLTEAAQKNLRESFGKVHQGTHNAHRVAILEEGADWINTQINPDDAQFLATRQFQVIEIARMLRLPPHKLGDYSQSHLANIEASNLDYLQTTLLGWVVAIEAELNLKLFSEAERADGYFIRHDITALMRGDMAARVSYYQGLRNMGAINADEIRSHEGMNPLGAGLGGEKFIVQGQYVELRDAGKATIAPPPKAERYNKHHGPDGKFTSAEHFGSHGGTLVPDKSKGGGPSVKHEPGGPKGVAAGKDLAGDAPKAVKAYHDGMSAGWRERLSVKEEGAVLGYTSSLYGQINGHLRHGKVDPGYDPESLKAIGETVAKALDKATLAEPLTVYRGVSDLKGLGLDPANLKGAVLRDKAFLSTSLTPKIAERFVSRSKAGAVFRISAPRGSMGASVAGITYRKDEHEVLFQRGSGLRLTGAERDAKGRLVVHAELFQ